jgi:hypothetical protein
MYYSTVELQLEISDFHSGIKDLSILINYDAASLGNLSQCLEKTVVSSPRVKMTSWTFWLLKKPRISK